MTFSPLSRLLLLFVFCAHVFAGLGYAQGLSWCFSSEGDARLEQNFLGDCETADPCTEESRKEAHADHGEADPEHCGDCLDFPLIAQDVQKTSRFSSDAEQVDSVPAALSAPYIALPHLLEEVPGFRPQPPPPQQLTLAFLRTVVLLN